MLISLQSPGANEEKDETSQSMNQNENSGTPELETGMLSPLFYVRRIKLQHNTRNNLQFNKYVFNEIC
jgi:hypothetical protein